MGGVFNSLGWLYYKINEYPLAKKNFLAQIINDSCSCCHIMDNNTISKYDEDYYKTISIIGLAKIYDLEEDGVNASGCAVLVLERLIYKAIPDEIMLDVLHCINIAIKYNLDLQPTYKAIDAFLENLLSEELLTKYPDIILAVYNFMCHLMKNEEYDYAVEFLQRYTYNIRGTEDDRPYDKIICDIDYILAICYYMQDLGLEGDTTLSSAITCDKDFSKEKILRYINKDVKQQYIENIITIISTLTNENN